MSICTRPSPARMRSTVSSWTRPWWATSTQTASMRRWVCGAEVGRVQLARWCRTWTGGDRTPLARGKMERSIRATVARGPSAVTSVGLRRGCRWREVIRWMRRLEQGTGWDRSCRRVLMGVGCSTSGTGTMTQRVDGSRRWIR